MKYIYNIYTLTILLIVSLAGYLLLFSHLTHSIVLYVIVAVSNSLLYILISSIILKLDLQRKYLISLIAAGVVFRMLLLPLSPIGSDDINRYIWDGKVQANGINPYRYAPSALELSHLSTKQLPSKMNFPDLKTIYPPVAQFVFYLSYELFGESYLGIKIFLLVTEILSLIILFALLKALNRDPKYLLLYALCPLPILVLMLDGHVDGIGFPFLLLFIYLFIRNKRLSSFILLGLSISAKIITIIILPLLLRIEKGKKILIALSVPVLVFLISYLPYFSGEVSPFETLMTFTSHWMFNGSIFNIFYNITGNNQTARIISYSLFLIPAALLFFSKLNIIKKVYYIFFLFFLFAPTVHPWYLTWLAVLLPLCFRWSGLMFVSLISLANYILIEYQLRGIWQESGLILFLEYVPVYGMILYELYLYILHPKNAY